MQLQSSVTASTRSVPYMRTHTTCTHVQWSLSISDTPLGHILSVLYRVVPQYRGTSSYYTEVPRFEVSLTDRFHCIAPRKKHHQCKLQRAMTTMSANGVFAPVDGRTKPPPAQVAVSRPSLGTSIGAGCSNQMQVAQGQDLH